LVKIQDHQVFIGLGSNLGNRESNLNNARELMAEYIVTTAASGIYETPPWGVMDQPPFLNQVIRGITRLSPLLLLDFLQKIECKMGRIKTIRFGPRLIDLDILLFDERQMTTQRLTIPHPRMSQRAFVLVPLNELDPGRILPDSRKSVGKLLSALDTTGIVLISPAKP
jgi:2-amino-4-hydroxy-6-hydroxymethyldihydropteridine diphosphokinase